LFDHTITVGARFTNRPRPPSQTDPAGPPGRAACRESWMPAVALRHPGRSYVHQAIRARARLSHRVTVRHSQWHSESGWQPETRSQSESPAPVTSLSGPGPGPGLQCVSSFKLPSWRPPPLGLRPGRRGSRGESAARRPASPCHPGLQCGRRGPAAASLPVTVSLARPLSLAGPVRRAAAEGPGAAVPSPSLVVVVANGCILVCRSQANP
jgi:hypothetical protein